MEKFLGYLHLNNLKNVFLIKLQVLKNNFWR